MDRDRHMDPEVYASRDNNIPPRMRVGISASGSSSAEKLASLSTSTSTATIPKNVQTMFSTPLSASERADVCMRHLVSSCVSCTERSGRRVRSEIGRGLREGRLSGLFDLDLDRDADGAKGGVGSVKALEYFLRLSEMVLSEVAEEDASESGSSEEEDEDEEEGNRTATPSSPKPRSPQSRTHTRNTSNTSNTPRSPMSPRMLSKQPQRRPTPLQTRTCQPTRQWYDLLLSLLTRIVLEGYLLCGWSGVEGLEVVFGFGGVHPSSSSTGSKEGEGVKEENDRGRGRMDPDGMKSLLEAYAVLFPSGLGGGKEKEKEQEREEKDVEEDERRAFMRRLKARRESFISLNSSSTPTTTSSSLPTSSSHSPPPTLKSHLLYLSTQHPCSALDESMLHFVEMLARWRGKGELVGVPFIENENGNDGTGVGEWFVSEKQAQMKVEGNNSPSLPNRTTSPPPIVQSRSGLGSKRARSSSAESVSMSAPLSPSMVARSVPLSQRRKRRVDVQE